MVIESMKRQDLKMAKEDFDAAKLTSQVIQSDSRIR